MQTSSGTCGLHEGSAAHIIPPFFHSVHLNSPTREAWAHWTDVLGLRNAKGHVPGPQQVGQMRG
jgi:hypothetical protein